MRTTEIYNDFLFKYGVRHQVVGRIGGDARGDGGISFLRPANLFSKTGTRRQAELLRMLMLAEPQIRV